VLGSCAGKQRRRKTKPTAPLPEAMIKGKAGNLIWNPTPFDFWFNIVTP
jgi:hypothetical protein